jgi:hypothetical protein
MKKVIIVSGWIKDGRQMKGETLTYDTAELDKANVKYEVIEEAKTKNDANKA